MIYYTYLIINKINGKSYVGAHASKNNIKDTYLGSGKLILQAIKKYGSKNFLKIKLQFSNSFKEAHELEKYYIKIFKTLVPIGYNICENGGYDSMKGRKFTIEHKKKLSKSHIGLIRSKETRMKMSKNHYDCKGNKNPMYKKGHKIEGPKNGMYENGHKIEGPKNGRSKIIIIHTPKNEIFLCHGNLFKFIKEELKNYNIKVRDFRKLVNGKLKLDNWLIKEYKSLNNISFNYKIYK